MLAEKQAINFMPFYSPTCTKPKFSFEEQEQELFQHCFEEGHDSTHDCRGAGDGRRKKPPGKSANSCDIKINVVELHGTQLQLTVYFLLLSDSERGQCRDKTASHQHGFAAVTVARGCIVCVLVLSGMKLERKASSLPVLSVVDALFTDVDLIYVKLVES